MSETTPVQPEPAATSTPASPRTPSQASIGRAAPRRGGTIALALLVALVALAGTAYVAWRGWQLEQASAAGGRAVDDLRQQVGNLGLQVNNLRDERAGLRQRLADADGVNRSLREDVLGNAERTRNLEDAVARLSERSVSGHDTMLLDEAESLLRMGRERFVLFNDAGGAIAAYTSADQALAAVNDGAYSGVRQSLNAEREALSKVKVPAMAHDLSLLSAMRGDLAQMPYRPVDMPVADEGAQGFFGRVGHALAGVISIQRDDGTPLAMADGRLARELALLDLAQAQAALLAFDDKGRTDALRRVDTTLERNFDPSDARVRQARAQIADMLLETTGNVAPPQLGAALAELSNARSVHALHGAPAAPAAASSAPAQGRP
ncbi:uroporphyrinogen-III C-methyltransferase [Pinirhizobacter sp.]|jgi:uroporphyrin-3 C-methyltransferase|uniref:uroporphyrinogen-III C-methyltransferase n=1 Tax=Pinirhizobacter sp. TaxID=2950432 RepID=UPI002F3FFABD